LLLFLLAGANVARPQTAIGLYQKAINQHQSGRTLEAVTSLREAVNLDSTFAEGFNSLCVALEELKRYQEAIDSCSRALALHPRDYRTLYNLGYVYSETKQTAEAIAFAEKTIAIKPDFAPARYLLARMYVDSNRFTSAVDSLQLLISTSRDGDAYNQLGVAYCHLKRYDEAIQAFTSGLHFDPHQPIYLTNLGTAYYLAGRYDEAVEVLELAVKTNPEAAVAQNNLGQAYLKVGRYDVAVDSIIRGQRMNATDDEIGVAESENNLGFAYAQLKRYPEALDHLARAVELSPHFAPAIFNLGIVRLATNDRGAALEQYGALKKIDENLAGRLFAKIYQHRVITAPKAP
jgi:tetratricopeptide (TPR) repeat protein